MKRGETKFTEEAIIAAKNALKKLPQKVSYIKRDMALLEMEEEIKEALEKGYDLKEISATLAEQGVNMPVFFLKTNLSKRKKKQSRKRPERQEAETQTELLAINENKQIEENM